MAPTISWSSFAIPWIVGFTVPHSFRPKFCHPLSQCLNETLVCTCVNSYSQSLPASPLVTVTCYLVNCRQNFVICMHNARMCRYAPTYQSSQIHYHATSHVRSSLPVVVRHISHIFAKLWGQVHESRNSSYLFFWHILWIAFCAHVCTVCCVGLLEGMCIMYDGVYSGARTIMHKKVGACLYRSNCVLSPRLSCLRDCC